MEMGRRNELEWQEISSRVVYQRFGRAIAEVEFQLPSARRDVFSLRSERPAVAVLALTVEQRVLLVRQFRPGPRRLLDELPGGYLDPGEDVLSAARRELAEETGYAGSLRVAGACFSDAYADCRKFCVVAVDCVPVQAAEPDRGEFLELVTRDLAEFRALLRSGQLTDTDAGYLGLDFLALLGSRPDPAQPSR